MIDVYAPEGTFSVAASRSLLRRIGEALLVWTGSTDIPFVRRNAGTYYHPLPPAHVTSSGEPDVVVRIHVTLPEVVLSTIERRRGFIHDATSIVAELSEPEHTAERTWISIVNSVDGGWGLGGHAYTNAEIDEV